MRRTSGDRVKVRGALTQTVFEAKHGPSTELSLQTSDGRRYPVELPAKVKGVDGDASNAENVPTGSGLTGTGTLKGGRIYLDSGTVYGWDVPKLEPSQAGMAATTHKVLVVPFYVGAEPDAALVQSQITATKLQQALVGGGTSGAGSGTQTVKSSYTPVLRRPPHDRRKTLPWQQLNSPRTIEYRDANGNVTSVDTCPYSQWERDVNAQLLTGENLSDYQHIVYVFPRGGCGIGAAGATSTPRACTCRSEGRHRQLPLGQVRRRQHRPRARSQHRPRPRHRPTTAARTATSSRRARPATSRASSPTTAT
ncbi:MAG: hypothetical protein PGN13_13750 [Patulibacter minatonensis]